MDAFKDIDEYISNFPEDIREILQQLRVTIQEAAPNAVEKIRYQMPTFALAGNLIHFAAYKNHIGLYPTPSGVKSFEKQLSVYKSGKGSIQLPLDQPIPYALVTKIVKYRVKENVSALAARKKKPKA